MLHSALPARAYLGAYLGAAGYVEEPAPHQQQHHHHHHQHHAQPYAYASAAAQQQHEAYVQAQRAVFHAWTSSQPSACPLDLSLKPPPPAASPIEVDDEEDRRSREEARSQHSAECGSICSSGSAGRYCAAGMQHRLVPEPPAGGGVDDQDSRSSSQHGYRLLQSPAEAELYRQPPPPPPPPPHIHAPMTPPSTPSPPQCPARRLKAPASPALTPAKPDKPDKPQAAPRQKKKHARRLKFDEDTSSPVSGTVILGPDEAVVTGDIDPAFNIVEVTDEARAELAKIENRLGPYQCKLCRQLHEDAFQLAQHRCSRIAHVEYRCPECDKRFSCPANLASHRRWHKPRPETSTATSPPAAPQDSLACTRCDAKFARPAALRKHLAQQHPPEQNNNNNNNNNNNHNYNVEEHEQPGKSSALAMEMA